ncbi:MotA/TolQ/ExbB proton channel family protein [Thalassotalea sp. M1531]|uniref:MotA/TolQ/ExbB proton channel family protein n=1 Tax=Thalassotalea algicola TaxID=2716224 RepID=A0A7Y0LES5_9GAMM|nr:MotA/TolQ/ExbB proton channel family protein [Thalassotalea algicola]NMP32832.1 MotA/TolQ/ExbB proton channel family protein [Thalassotalea algicola]
MLTLIDNIFPWFGDMLELGGDILLLIIIVAAIMWALILERLVYFNYILPTQQSTIIKIWQQRTNKLSWTSQHLRSLLISRVIRSSQTNLELIKTLVKVCPLLGLLGTVMGMLEIFDALAITGNNSARSTAGGVSKATVSTMAGMVVAISGLMISNHLSNKAALLRNQLQKRLTVSKTAVTAVKE